VKPAQAGFVLFAAAVSTAADREAQVVPIMRKDCATIAAPMLQPQSASQLVVDRLQVRLGHRAELSIDHRPLDRANEGGHHRWKKQARGLSVAEQVVSNQTSAHIAGDCCHNHFLACAVV
jgi:hypothetical protein